MFCFAKMCCICVSNDRALISIQTKSKNNNLTILEKIVYCMKEDFIQYIMPDGFICFRCRDGIQRIYTFMSNAEQSNNLLKTYAAELSNNYTQTSGNLQVWVNHNPSDIPKLIQNTDKDENKDVKIEYTTDNYYDEFTQNIKVEPVDTEFINYDYMCCDTICKEEESLEHTLNSQDLILKLEFDESLNSIDTLDKENGKENTDINLKTNETKEDIIKHEEKRKKLNPVQCLFCNALFYSENCMNRHLSVLHSNKRFNCRNCDLSFNREVTLRNHSLKHKVHEKL